MWKKVNEKWCRRHGGRVSHSAIFFRGPQKKWPPTPRSSLSPSLDPLVCPPYCQTLAPPLLMINVIT